MRFWALIEDLKGDKMIIETTDYEIWLALALMEKTEKRMWIGSIIELPRNLMENKWGFCFNADKITLAGVTAEGLQTTINFISKNLDYWLNNWAFIYSKVAKTMKL